MLAPSCPNIYTSWALALVKWLFPHGTELFEFPKQHKHTIDHDSARLPSRPILPTTRPGGTREAIRSAALVCGKRRACRRMFSHILLIYRSPLEKRSIPQPPHRHRITPPVLVFCLFFLMCFTMLLTFEHVHQSHAVCPCLLIYRPLSRRMQNLEFIIKQASYRSNSSNKY